MSVAAIVVAAGSGERLGAGTAKALVLLNGRPLFEWAAVAMSRHPRVDSVVVVTPRSARETIQRVLGPEVTVVAGGHTRQQSVLLGLAAADPEAEFVLVHDAARPLVPAGVISAVLDGLLAGASGVVPVLPVTDTIKRVDERGTVTATIDRSDLRAVQTPQGFQRSILDTAHAEAQELGSAGTTDDAGLLEAMGLDIMTVPGSELSFKITTPHDLLVAEALAASSDILR